MEIKNIIDEDFSNYKECSMFVGFPTCTFKCEHDCGMSGMCQNTELYKAKSIEYPVEKIVERYMNNPLSRAMVCGGLEPFDHFTDLIYLVSEFRKRTTDPIVIYTGYYKEEISHKIQSLIDFNSNIIVKFGRFVPNQNKRFDELLGVELASDNQYAERIC